MDLDELLGIDYSKPEQRVARYQVDQDGALMRALRAMREERGRTQQDVATAMGISQSAVAKIETGLRDPHLSTLRRYALAVGAVVTHAVDRSEVLSLVLDLESNDGSYDWAAAGRGLRPRISELISSR